jgi:hypothetical protein
MKIEQDWDKWERELKEAGWKPHGSSHWIAPWGDWYRGPYKAWCVMGALSMGLRVWRDDNDDEEVD